MVSAELWRADSFRSVPDEAVEGFDVGGELQDMRLKLPRAETFLDFGCGRGRLTKCFRPGEYMGYDWNPDALAESAIRNEGYKFISEPNYADVWFAVNVLMHNDDEWVEAWQPDCRYLIIAEVMDAKFRKGEQEGMPAAWHRDPSWYASLWGTPMLTRVQPCPRYEDTDYHILCWRRGQ